MRVWEPAIRLKSDRAEFTPPLSNHCDKLVSYWTFRSGVCNPVPFKQSVVIHVVNEK